MAKYLISLEVLRNCEAKGLVIRPGKYQGVAVDHPNMNAEGGASQALFLCLGDETYTDPDDALEALSVHVDDLVHEGAIIRV